MHRRSWWSVVAVAALLAACAPLPRAGAQGVPQTVVLVSIDGFHPDYLRRLATPNLNALAARGVRAQWMVPAFPANTFPNHYTIVTGLLPAHHGIVDNTFIDPSDGVEFRYTQPVARQSRWWQGEALWTTAARQGVLSASYFWPGSDVDDPAKRPTIAKRYDGNVPDSARVDSALAWLVLPEAGRPRFITVYISDVDHTGHSYGPDSPELAAAVLHADLMVGRLTAGIQRLGLVGSVNVIVVSDHGQAATSRDRVVILDDYLPRDSIIAISLGSTIAIRRRGGITADSIVRALSAAPHIHVYERTQTPERWHYRDNPRIADVVGAPDAGWVLTTRAALAANRRRGGAEHGYDNADSTMRAMFVAAGPAFRQGVVVAPFQNLHVYDLVCGILGITPAPNDGSPDSTRAMLR